VDAKLTSSVIYDSSKGRGPVSDNGTDLFPLYLFMAIADAERSGGRKIELGFYV